MTWQRDPYAVAPAEQVKGRRMSDKRERFEKSSARGCKKALNLRHSAPWQRMESARAWQRFCLLDRGSEDCLGTAQSGLGERPQRTNETVSPPMGVDLPYTVELAASRD